MPSVPSLPENQMIFSGDQLKESGFSHYQINRLVQNKELKKLNKKNYENLRFTGELNEFYYAGAFIPDGIICLMSAAVYYNLSTIRPDSIDIAVRQKDRISTLPDWPPLRLHYFSDERYSTGIEIIHDGPNSFQIYDLEKTVADIVSFRNKIGIEETKEVLTSYLRRNDRNLNRLMRYAARLRCYQALKTYLEVLV